MKCCIIGCDNEATVSFIFKSVGEGKIPFCKKCQRLFELHRKARDNLFNSLKKKGLVTKWEKQ